ncbi:hypothetical protein MTR67_026605 [Solanum verrucosum]|uniref:Uncharacterized protein n=1 Tax=Solanum verrucosum TaxID=315347 RepID=A0AAF0TZ95_SOLVR|nr:hypothetical protein MTR67_026605 [Solanum verrucosum]
MAPFEALYG